MTKAVGILALQGAVSPHEEKLRSLGVLTIQVRKPEHLLGLGGIILPGGESTAMIHLLKLNGLWEPLKKFVKTTPTWGVCAGSILLAKHVLNPSQESLETMEIEVERNAFGRQTESFISPVQPTSAWDGREPIEGIFIRAPRIRKTFGSTRVLFTLKDEPVMVEAEHLLVTTFHPELTESNLIHQYFLKKCKI